METAHNPASLGASTAEALTGQPAGSLRFDWLYVGLSTLLIGGVFLDGWAHTHGKVDQSFFTPWHAVLYSGFVILAAFLAWTLFTNHRKGYAWRKAIAPGYETSVLGAAIFAVGGVGDLIWHTLFGIEKGIEGNISPSHLTLALGGMLLFSGPLRSAWRRVSSDGIERWGGILPALLALTYQFSLLSFFMQYASPIVQSRADLNVTTVILYIVPNGPTLENDLSTRLGVVSILVSAGISMGVVLLAVRRWRLPVGSFALMYAINGLLMSFLAQSSPVIEVAIFSALLGLIVDLFNLALKPSVTRVGALRAFAFIVPALNYLVYFGVLLLINGAIWWSVHLWTGTIVEAGFVGLLLSYLVVPPQVAGSAQNS